MYQLLEFINENSIVALCKTNTKLNKICKQYIEMEDDKRFEVIVTDNKWNNTVLLGKFCMNNNVIKIIKLIKIDLEWNWGLKYACAYGYINIVRLLIEKGANDRNYALYYACRYCHTDIVKLMIEKDANKCTWCYKSMEEHIKKIK